MPNPLLIFIAVIAAVVIITLAVNAQCGPDESQRRSLWMSLRTLLFGWRSMWSIRLERRHRYPFCRVVPLPEAARMAREQTCNSRAAAKAAVVCDGDQVTGISYFAALLGDSNAVSLYGYHRVSRQLERIAQEDFKQAQLVDDATALKRYWEGVPIYTNLQIPRCDLRRRVEELVSAE